MRRGSRHRRRRLSRGDHRVATVGQTAVAALEISPSRYSVGERAFDQWTGRSRVDTGPDQRQEIESKIRK
jgi:hypothetical protein